jgi:hypothetical protein
VLPATSGREVEGYLRDLPELTRHDIAARARRRVLASHTADHRAIEFESYVDEVLGDRTSSLAMTG